jgi:tRNA 2-thiouridine synthesizing protein C
MDQRTGPGQSGSPGGGEAIERAAERPVLLMFRRPPYGTVFPAEGLRMAEALLAFQVPLRLVFVEDGVFNLVKGQGNRTLGLGDLGAAFAGLASQGLPEILVLDEDLSARGLPREALVDGPVRAIRVAELRALIEEAKVVMPF